MEKHYADRWGGVRTGALGKAVQDVKGAFMGNAQVECKLRANFPSWLTDAVAQITQHCDDGSLPLLVLHKKNRQYETDLIVIPRTYFEDWFGGDLLEGKKASGPAPFIPGTRAETVAPVEIVIRYPDGTERTVELPHGD